MTIFCSLYIWWFWARFWRLLLLPNHPHGQLMPETRRSFVARLRSLINEFPVINMRLPGNAPWCSIVLRELCRGCRAKPWPGGNRISVRARLYDYTSCPEIRIVFHVQLRQIHPVAVATMGISKLRKLFSHLLPLWPWPPPVPGGGGIFLLPLMTNYGKFLTLQTATHKTHKTHKTHNCHVLIDTPLPYRGIFSPVLIVFCWWLRQIGKERICGALSKIIFFITQTLMASPCNPGGFFNLSLCFVIHSEYR